MNLALIILCVLIYMKYGNTTDKRLIKKFVYFITLLLILFSGLRHEGVGNDTYAYMNNFDDIALRPWSDIFSNFWDLYLNPGSQGKDPGELVIIKACTCFLPNSRAFLFFVAAVLLIPLGIFVYRNSDSLRIPCFFYVFYITMFYPYLPNSAVRQSFALTILIVGYMLLQKGKVKHLAALIFIASFVHKSILISLLILPYYYFKNTKLAYRYSALLIVAMLFGYSYVGMYLASQSEIYEVYAYSTANANSMPYMVILMMIGLYAIGWVVVDKDNSAYEHRLFYGGAAMAAVWVIMVRLDPSVIRLVSYFGPWMGLLVPYAVGKLPAKDAKTLFTILLIIFLFRAAITPDNYHFMWQEMKLHERY